MAEDTPRTILEATQVGFDAANAKIAELAQAFLDAGWPAALVLSRVWVEDALYVGATEAHAAGDVSVPAHEETHWWLRAAFSPLRLSARLHWKEEVTPKGARSFKFHEAMCTDPVGIPTELYVDYRPSANDLKQVKGEPDWAHRERAARTLASAERMDGAYNDGADYLNHNPIFAKVGDFETWLNEALDMSAKYLERNAA